MGQPRRGAVVNVRHPWIPPIPAEHGARSMLGAALLTPVAVAIIRAQPVPQTAIAYLAFALLGIVGLAFREALRQHLMAPSEFQARLTPFVAIEGAAMVILVAILAVMTGPIWALTILTIPAIVMDIFFRRRLFSGRILGTVTGAVSLSFAVPLGVFILDIGGSNWAVWLYILFVAFHLTAIARVLTVRARGGERYPSVRLGNVGFHVGLFALAAGGWSLGILGPGAPLLFIAGAIRMGYLLRQSEPPTLSDLGRGERAFTAAFILCAPWVLPI